MHPNLRQNTTSTGPSGGYEALFASSHSYIFNGMEKDDEVKGLGNSLDFGARLYDSRLGRWSGIDPLYKQYSFSSLYTFLLDNPIYIKTMMDEK
jgi:RHS repeat-associated protein